MLFSFKAQFWKRKFWQITIRQNFLPPEVCIIQYVLYSMYYIVCIIQYVLYSMYYTVYIIQYVLYSMYYTVCIQYVLYSLYYTVCYQIIESWLTHLHNVLYW